MTTINLAESQNLPFACLPRLYFLLFAIVALHLSRVLYKSTLFMQNKPNLLNAKMNTTACITRPYEVLTPRPRRANKPNQTQFLFYLSCRKASFRAGELGLSLKSPLSTELSNRTAICKCRVCPGQLLSVCVLRQRCQKESVGRRGPFLYRYSRHGRAWLSSPVCEL